MSEKIRYAEVVVPSYTSYWAYKDEAELRRTVNGIYGSFAITPVIRVGISRAIVSKSKYWKQFRADVKRGRFKNHDNFNLGSLVEQ